MATVAAFITDARYDLRDYGTGLEYDDDEILVYINRMIKVFDSTLTSMNSSFVSTESALIIPAATLSYNLRTNLNSGKWDSVRSLWIDSNRLEKISRDLMYYKRKFNSTQQVSGYALVVGVTYEILARTTLDFTASGAAANTAGTVFVCTVTGTLGTGDAVNVWTTGEPQFWCLQEPSLLFEYPTNQIYSFTLHYNKKTGTVVVGDSMPYSDIFNDAFRELLVMHAKAKKEGVIGPTEQTYSAIFRKLAFEYTLRTDTLPKYYHSDF